MTQKQIEQTRVIAEYDGWKIIGEPEYTPPFKCYHKGIKVIPVINPKGEEHDDWTTYMPYLTDLNALHNVAMDVMEGLSPHRVAAICLRTDIKSSILCRSINGQYIDLFNAVYDGIVFLNQSKTTP